MNESNKDSLKLTKCDCGQMAEQIINVTDDNGNPIKPNRIGWWCRACYAFTKAILRERVVDGSW